MTSPEFARTTLGQSEAHLCGPGLIAALGAPIHRDVVVPFLSLQAAAREAGFELAVLSGFRGFERQLSIWNRKAAGELPVLDSAARPLDPARLGNVDLAFAILRWSALPGASRHHWGTDLDIFDAAACPPGYAVELVPGEVESGGMFAAMHQWLDERIARDAAWGFFRPYDRDRGGVAPERWHLSHAPTAAAFQRRLAPALLHEALRNAEIRLRDAVLDHLDEIFARFVMNVNPGRS